MADITNELNHHNKYLNICIALLIDNDVLLVNMLNNMDMIYKLHMILNMLYIRLYLLREIIDCCMHMYHFLKYVELDYYMRCIQYMMYMLHIMLDMIDISSYLYSRQMSINIYLVYYSYLMFFVVDTSNKICHQRMLNNQKNMLHTSNHYHCHSSHLHIYNIQYWYL